MSNEIKDMPKDDPDAEYVLGPDSQLQAGAPKGRIIQYRWENSKIFPGTVRDYWVAVFVHGQSRGNGRILSGKY